MNVPQGLQPLILSAECLLGQFLSIHFGEMPHTGIAYCLCLGIPGTGLYKHPISVGNAVDTFQL